LRLQTDMNQSYNRVFRCSKPVTAFCSARW